MLRAIWLRVRDAIWPATRLRVERDKAYELLGEMCEERNILRAVRDANLRELELSRAECATALSSRDTAQETLSATLKDLASVTAERDKLQSERRSMKVEPVSDNDIAGKKINDELQTPLPTGTWTQQRAVFEQRHARAARFEQTHPK